MSSFFHFWPFFSSQKSSLSLLRDENFFSLNRSNGASKNPSFLTDFKNVHISVAEPGCLSRIPDPDFYPSGIPDLGSRISDPGSRIADLRSRISDRGSQIPDLGSKNSNKREGWKKICCHTFFVAINFTKLKIILFLECWRKKFGQIFKEL